MSSLRVALLPVLSGACGCWITKDIVRDWAGERAVEADPGDDGDTGVTDSGTPEGDTADTAPVSGPNLEIRPGRYDFGEVDVGASASTTLLVRNTGTEDCLVSDLRVSDAVLTLGGTLSVPEVIRPGTSETLEVTFTPDAVASWAGSVTLVSDDPDTPESVVTIDGSGVDGCAICAPRIDVDNGGADPYSMGDFLSIGGSVDARTVVVSNVGDLDLTVSVVRVNNDFMATCGTFSVVGWSGSVTLAPYDTVSFDVEYSASGSCIEVPQAGIDANVLHILSDDPAEPDFVIELGAQGL